MGQAGPAVGEQSSDPHGHGLAFDAARAAAHRLGAARAAAPVTVTLAHAVGAVLAQPLHARTDVPLADASAMDGFAVANHGPWRVRGTVLAGGSPTGPIGSGEAVEVATGALVPEGTDRVLPVEVVRVRNEDGTRWVEPAGPLPDRRHVRPRGEECAAGVPLLRAGRRVGAGVVGLAASTGSDELVVRPRPRVATLVTGDELVSAGLPVPGQVRDAIGPLLPSAVSSLGGDLVLLERCGDGPGQLDRALAGLLAADCDVVVTCGMAGAGPADRLRPWLHEVGAELVVDGVAVRPGHPQVLASLPDGRPLVGLPGNPLAAVAALLGLLGPLLGGMTGLTATVAERAVLQGWQPRGRPATTLVPVRRCEDRTVTPSGPAGPAQLRGLAAADAVAVVPQDWDGTEPVELLPVP